jgi:ureidoacrylate peracid hydrolase
MASERPAFDAVLIIDMQNSFLHPDGGTYAITGAPLVRIPETIAKNRELIAAARAASIPIVFTRQTYRAGHVDAGWVSLDKFDIGSTKALLEGTWDIEITDELDVQPGDYIVDKPRMDAFYNTNLEVLLRGLGAHRIAIGGIVSNACVETTTRSAAMRDFDVTVFADCCSTLSETDHVAAMNSIQRFGFADVVDLDATAF